jgi:hypothetical protein
MYCIEDDKEKLILLHRTLSLVKTELSSVRIKAVEKAISDLANNVWKNRRKSNQNIYDDICLSFFLLFLLCSIWNSVVMGKVKVHET